MSPEAPGRWSRLAPWLFATGFYVAFTIIQTQPLITHLPEVIPSDLGDPVLNVWTVWWNAHAVPLTARWWNAPSFWPSTGTLAFSETLLGLSPITTPIQWLGGSPITAYNVAFLLTFLLSALGAHGLVYRLTNRHDAAFIAGLIYGFHPFRTAHFPQIQVMTSYWMPVALLGLHEYLRRQETRWLALSGGAWLMQALSNGYYLLFFPVLVGLWMIWFALSRSMIRAFAAIAAAFAVASLPLVPMLWTYRRIHSTFSFQRGIGEVNAFGADLTSFLDASPLLQFWRLTRFHRAEGELFPGFTATLLVALLLGSWLWRSERGARVPRARRLLLAASFIFLGFALSTMILGPWSFTVGGLTLLSVRIVSKPLSIGLLLFAMVLLTTPQLAAAWRRRSPLMFYVLAMGAMYLLSFGPRPHFLGEPFMYRGPYSLLMMLPGYDSIRVPARFAMLAVLCLSVVAAFAFARLTARIGRRPRMLLAAAVACGVLVDSAIGEMPLKTLPLRFYSLESLPGREAVAELPFGDSSGDVEAMYRGIFHRRPVANGYSGFFPRGFEMLRRGFATRDPQMLDVLTAFGPVVIVIDKAQDADGRWETQVASRSGATLVAEESGRKMYALPAGAMSAEVGVSDRLPIQWAAASVNGDRMPLALDGNPETRWDSGPQKGSEIVTIDLGTTQFVDGVTMTIGSHLSDFPRSLAIDTSDDGYDWTNRWQGSSAVIAFAAAVRRPNEMPLTFGLPHVPTRWLRLRQLGNDPVYYWSIFELSVFGG